MKPRLSETELLDLVEGQLDPARVAAVRQALLDDPALLKRVEGMVADRALLRDLQSERLSVPTGVIARALEEAEREALLGAPAVAGRIRPARLRPILALAAVVAMVGGVTFVVWLAVNGAMRPTPRAITDLADSSSERISETEIESPEEEDSVVLADASDANAAESIGSDDSLAQAKVELDPTVQRQLEDWTNVVDRAVQSDEFAALLEGRAPASGLPPLTDEIIDQAIAGQLVLQVTLPEQAMVGSGSGAEELQLKDIVLASAITPSHRNAQFNRSADLAEPAPGVTAPKNSARAQESSASSASIDTEVVELAVPKDAARDHVRRTLEELLIRLNAHGSVRVISQSPASKEKSAAWSPQLIDWTAHEVLWWSREPSQWPTPRVFARVFIEYTAKFTNDAQPPANP